MPVDTAAEELELQMSGFMHDLAVSLVTFGPTLKHLTVWMLNPDSASDVFVMPEISLPALTTFSFKELQGDPVYTAALAYFLRAAPYIETLSFLLVEEYVGDELLLAMHSLVHLRSLSVIGWHPES
jgi:hypothetical protein